MNAVYCLANDLFLHHCSWNMNAVIQPAMPCILLSEIIASAVGVKAAQLTSVQVHISL